MNAASEGDNFSLTTSLRYDPLILSHSEASSSPIYLLPQHHQRLLDAAHALQFHEAVKFLESTVPNGSALQQVIEDSFIETYGTQQPNTPLKIRMLLPPSRPLEARASPYRPQITSASVPALPLSAFIPSSLPHPGNLPGDLHKWDIYLLPHPFTAPSHPPTRHKTTARGAYGEATAELNAVLDNRREAGERMVEILLPVVGPNTAEAGRELEISEGSLTTPFFYRDGRWITPRGDAGGCNGVSRRYALEHGLAVIGTVSASSVNVGETVYLGNGVRGFSWGVVHAWPGTDGDRKT